MRKFEIGEQLLVAAINVISAAAHPNLSHAQVAALVGALQQLPECKVAPAPEPEKKPTKK